MARPKNKPDPLRKMMKKGRNVFTSAELVNCLGNRTAIHRLVQADQLLALGSGFYSTPRLDPSIAQVHVVGRFYPKAVISGVSALVIHRLSDEKADRVAVDISKETKLANKILEVRRVARSRLVGIIHMDYFGQRIRVYNVERTLCDAYRIDRGALFFKALKRYLREYSPNPEKIAKYDKILGTKVLSSLQQELASA